MGAQLCLPLRRLPPRCSGWTSSARSCVRDLKRKNRSLRSTTVEPAPPTQAIAAEDTFAFVVDPEQREAILHWIVDVVLREVRSREVEGDRDERG